MKTTLINYRTYNLNLANVTPIDRRSMFGNKFIINKDGTREEVVEKYKEWFLLRTNVDAFFDEAVQNLRGKTLGCWCTPLPCHGDVIIEYLENLD